MSFEDRPALGRIVAERRRISEALEMIVHHSAADKPSTHALTELADLKQAVIRLEVGVFDNLLAAGWSWAQLGHGFGVTKQTMFKRYRRLLKAQE